MQGWKLQDWIETDEFAGVKNAGLDSSNTAFT